MRIGLDGFPLTELKTGVGTYTIKLACALANGAPQDEFELVAPRPFSAAALADSRPGNLDLVYSKPSPLHQRWWSIGLPAYIRRHSLMLYHGTNFDVPLQGRCPTVLTIHDLSWRLHSNTHEASVVRRGRLRLPLMARRATMIVTPSDRVRREVCEYLKIRPDKVFSVPLAPNGELTPLPSHQTLEVRKRLGIEKEFLLFVGTIEPRKNLSTLLSAFEEIIRTTALRPQLVVAGKLGWKADKLLSQLERFHARDRVLLTGYLPDEELAALYSSCHLFIYPSIYEGFGLPPLEAMACGAAVLASPVPSMTESSETAAHIVAPDDIHALAKAIVDLFNDAHARQSLSAAGLNYVKNFSWERTAALTREVYEEAIKRKRHKTQKAQAI
jgi:glycosyltransferase involved in cell wall biosynthesis